VVDTARFRIVIFPLTEGQGGGWIAEVPELPGCMGHGATPGAALKALDKAGQEWFRTAKARGIPIPKPLPPEREFSGIF
jgi:antitoxin HicB